MTSKLSPLVTACSLARFFALAMLAVQVPLTGATVPGQPLPGWERGMLDIHQINTGTGNSAFFVLPDGTTVLLDAAAGYREAKVKSRYDAPPRPNASLRPGQWIARYVRRMHPEGAGGVLDYAVLTHFHEDHIGALTASSPKAASGAYRLTGITDVAEEVRMRKLLDRGWPTYDYPAPSGGEVMLTYGAFAYFNGADLAGVPSPNAAAWTEMESAVAWACGPVDVAVVNHHGSPDVANAFFLSVLQPRIHIISIYAASQPGPDVLRRLLSERSYPGPREVFMTNWLWPGRREHMVKLYGETDAAWLVDRINHLASNQGHVLVRVDPGGASYRVIVIDDSRDDGLVLSVHGPYESRAPSAHDTR